ncbi:hypothetical protein D9M68_853330 [compost metagenome]
MRRLAPLAAIRGGGLVVQLQMQAQVGWQALRTVVGGGLPLAVEVQALHGVALGVDAQAEVAMTEHRLLPQQAEQAAQPLGLAQRLLATVVALHQGREAGEQADHDNHHQHFQQGEARTRALHVRGPSCRCRR